MAITIQAKQLKQWLKDAGIRNYANKPPRVRTEIIRRSAGGYRYREFGNAYSHVPKRFVTEGQLTELKRQSEYIKVVDNVTWWTIIY